MHIVCVVITDRYWTEKTASSLPYKTMIYNERRIVKKSTVTFTANHATESVQIGLVKLLKAIFCNVPQYRSRPRNGPYGTVF